jgi:ethanolamine ammonia-lyase small subunit
VQKTPSATTGPDAEPIVSTDPWEGLKQFTDARIALGRSGVSLPLGESLSFRLAHARARDAVHAPFQSAAIIRDLETHGFECLELRSAVSDRGEYLTRPDKGRRLDDASRELLRAHPGKGADICLAVGDGLSSRAIHENAVAFVRLFAETMVPSGLTLSPVSVVHNSRVAVADEIGQALEARLSVILIGERPGLSSPDSMGVYLTWNPRAGTTDEARNCISNVRPAGLPVAEGVRKLAYLVEEACRLHASGVPLKDRMPANYLPFGRELPRLS